MATTPEAVKGVPRIEGNPAPALRGDHNALADYLVANLDSSVAAYGNLPTSGNWTGRRRYVVAELSWYVWVSASTGWIPDTNETATAFSFQGIYTNANAAYEPVKAVVMGGRVYLEGVVSNNTPATFVGAEVYTLGSVPAALAPAKVQTFATTWGGTGLASLVVNPSGTVQTQLSSGASNVPTGLFLLSMSSVSWRMKRR